MKTIFDKKIFYFFLNQTVEKTIFQLNLKSNDMVE